MHIRRKYTTMHGIICAHALYTFDDSLHQNIIDIYYTTRAILYRTCSDTAVSIPNI